MTREQKRRGDGVDKEQGEGSAKEADCRERDVPLFMHLSRFS